MQRQRTMSKTRQPKERLRRSRGFLSVSTQPHVFARPGQRQLSYPAASALRHTVTFDRPEGSFAARAFGNVVHRYLQVLAAQLEYHATCDELLAELPSWESRLAASLRGEGLPPALVTREAVRAQKALAFTLGDPVGRWILSPQASAASERALTVAAIGSRGLRVDRTFLAGARTLVDRRKPHLDCRFQDDSAGSTV